MARKLLPRWLFVNEVQLAVELIKCDLSCELCQRFVNSVKMTLMGLRMHLSVRPRAPAEWSEHW